MELGLGLWAPLCQCDKSYPLTLKILPLQKNKTNTDTHSMLLIGTNLPFTPYVIDYDKNTTEGTMDGQKLSKFRLSE